MPRRHRYLKRIEEDGFHGFVVSYPEEDRRRTCHFADDEYGTADGALEAAVWFLKLRPGSSRPRGAPGTTGVTGVLEKAGYYQAFWYSWDGRRVNRTFSWAKHGKEKALRLAARTVRESEEEASGVRSLPRRAPSRSQRANGKRGCYGWRPTSYKNVFRLDHPRFHGFVVQTIRDGARHLGYLSDQPHGRRVALAAALRYRDSL